MDALNVLIDAASVLMNYTKSPRMLLCTDAPNAIIIPQSTIPVLSGIEKLSSMRNRIDAASTTPPMKVATAAVAAYCHGACVSAHTTPTTSHDEIQNAVVPSKLLSRNFLLPNLRPISADEMSETMSTAKAVIATILGKMRTHSNADSNT